MKKIIIIVLIISVAIFSYFIFFKKTSVTNYPSEGRNIVAFGDSLISGVGATKGNDLISDLSRDLGVDIINAGVSGNTTVDGLERLEKDVLDHNPKIVILLLGGNDYLKRIDKVTTFENLQKIVDAVHSKGSIVLLLGVRGGLLKDNYREDFDEFAKKNNVAYVPNVLDDILGDEKLMYDQVHPNDRGYKIIALRVRPVLKELLE